MTMTQLIKCTFYLTIDGGFEFSTVSTGLLRCAFATPFKNDDTFIDLIDISERIISLPNNRSIHHLCRHHSLPMQ